jgi:FkbM family methyltransferase
MQHSVESISALKQELERLLALSQPEIATREKEIRSRVSVDKNNRPLLFGCGELGQVCADRLRKCGIEPVAFCDNNPKRWGTVINGIPVMSLADALNRFGEGVPIVVTIYTARDLRNQLRAKGLNVIAFADLAIKYPDMFLPYYCVDLPSRMQGHEKAIREAFDLWADDRSRAEYVAQIRHRYLVDDGLPAFDAPSTVYFPEDLTKLTDEEVFVDCGAYDGDSIARLVAKTSGKFKRAIAIEADPKNVERMEKRFVELGPDINARTRIHVKAASDHTGTIRFNSTGSVTSSFHDTATSIEVTSQKLDDMLREDPPPTFIKMDIEGAEPLAIAGAAQTIAKHRPFLAICLYHRQSDIWQIPLQIRSITSRYNLYLRRYSDDAWEQLVYAVPKD